GGPVYLGLWAADKALPWIGKPGVKQADGEYLSGASHGLHKLALGLIPAAGIGVFLGLSATTLTLLKHEGVPLFWAPWVRFGLLSLAMLWSFRLVWRLTASRTTAITPRLTALGLVA